MDISHFDQIWNSHLEHGDDVRIDLTLTGSGHTARQQKGAGNHDFVICWVVEKNDLKINYRVMCRELAVGVYKKKTPQDNLHTCLFLTTTNTLKSINESV